MASAAEAPSCPRCGETMVPRTASKGSSAGQQFWGCRRYPNCRGTTSMSPAASAPTASFHRPKAGASAQAEFDRRRREHVAKLRRAWPLIVGLTLILMLLGYLGASTYFSPPWGVAAAAGTAIVMLITISAFPQTIDAWRIGAAGEQRTGRYLEGSKRLDSSYSTIGGHLAMAATLITSLLARPGCG
jgi:hypothetical protein